MNAKNIFICIGIMVLSGAVIIVLFIGLRTHNTQQSVSEAEPNGTFCYSRHQLATADAPYEVSEHITLTLRGGSVTGVKSGTQVGPDMSNGYDGYLTGIRAGDSITVSFAYTIEGSDNTEVELYTMGDTLVKHRYPLIDEGNRLVPDTAQAFTDIEYHSVDCQ